ncbi:MAG: bifunctional (p)ppGpp synthetase/guanosine-3',5'-bis(diphosphate) 3'-pyrophosphohydrolase [Pseudomonadales bacterium]|nr:bifunctional (p)ppGpp synthetase/guanosine-3',5'-bis(diphosphate) 3'-pyrophosphohydrolase [Pseudomonadales bacterium]MCP5331137.1 bifunctional (p)ppGpp synthetase/guanosine-3',5'-bis(diphosphate) 3'-pyrophosphohydrolase [Pseudomonadales bacterium]MCP5343600.1 bifunctional (p)ppGpp synthetase/guanosine-3',5'-bis(diphosphate) 3'-pyrophosphohydrolase [Pseudomonadales bacterium]
MVHIRASHPFNPDGSIRFDDWFEALQGNGVPLDRDMVQRACDVSWQVHQASEAPAHPWFEKSSSYITGLDMAEILVELHLDSEAVVAAILYRSVRESRLDMEELERQFGAGVAKLVEGVLRMAAINETDTSRKRVLGQSDDQVENVRKMLLALIDDVRVALLKLAERTCAIRAVKNSPVEKRLRVAREVFEIYVPLAHRLGIGQLKWELEDLSFRYLQEENYKRIATLLDERRVDRERFIAEVTQQLRRQLERANIDAEVTGRAKNIYSIWRKMQNKKLDFSQIFDIRAVRILVPEVRDCYATLGIVHNLWRVIPNEFDDYIATPKENGYQSLHTAVIGPDSKVFEIQIRTFAMDEDAELGVCAHWRYKEGIADPNYKDSFEDKIAWLRQLLAWHDEMGMAGGLAEQLRSDSTTPDRVYVFTPEGHVVDMMKGATPLDFAYYVHTEIGNKCCGARVNGQTVPLNYRLQTGDRVEVLADDSSTPSRDWLKPSLGFANTPRAQAKLIQWFKTQGREQNIALGKSLLDEEFERLAVSAPNFRELARRLGCRNADALFAAVGVGAITVEEVIAAAQELSQLLCRLDDDAVREAGNPKMDAQIYGAGRLATQFAGCCHPVQGDAIVGCLNHDNQVVIHRSDCPVALQYRQAGHENFIEVQWSEGRRVSMLAELFVLAYDRAGLLRDISTILADAKIEVMQVNTRSDKQAGTARMNLQVEVESFHALSRVLDKISRLNNVIEVRRINGDKYAAE